ILESKPNVVLPEFSNSVFLASEILKVAKQFDLLTGMMMGHKPQSEIMAMNYLRDHAREYNETIVSVLAQCIHIIPAGASVDLSTRDKGIVLVENPKNYMEPVILRLSDNQIYDLSDPAVSQNIQIVDLMKTMDNRVEIDEDTLKQFHADERIIEMTEKYKKHKKS
ncbi:MAG: phosphohydrolase, partial [Agathobacter sp.]|nr:phosphohydrolase [Agathobacter sp.]